MIRTNREIVQAALVLHQHLANRQQYKESISLPTYAWAGIQGIQRQIDLARRRGWHGAAKRLNDDLVDAVADCHRQLETSLRGWKPPMQTSPPSFGRRHLPRSHGPQGGIRGTRL